MNRLPMYTSGTYCVWCNICVTTIPEIHGESRGLSLLVVPYLPNLGQLAGAWQQTGKLPPRYADIDRLRRGIKELSVLVLIIFTAYIDIYCGRNQKPVPPILIK